MGTGPTMDRAAARDVREAEMIGMLAEYARVAPGNDLDWVERMPTRGTGEASFGTPADVEPDRIDQLVVSLQTR